MRLNHADVVLGYEGEPLQEAVMVNGKQQYDSDDKPLLRDMTFRSLVFSALNTIDVENGERMGAEAKARCFELSLKFFKGKFADLTVDEAAFIKDRAGVVLTALVYGRLCDWIEGKPQLVMSDDDDDVQLDEITPPSGGS